MFTNAEKKKAERKYFDAFTELRPDLGITGIQGGERPDFICSVRGTSTGVEMTRFFFPSADPIPPQAVNGYRDQLSQALCAEHLRRQLPPLHASVHLFSEEKLLASTTRKLLVESLVDFVQMNIPNIGPHVEFDNLPHTLTE